ncbi:MULTISPECIES: putative zinc-binding metallopeptidase [unclassified Agrococcus]|uniref:zinc-binding metallopeptidase family protein n=1 Tax=unclassified Agrococcus TaxID=2615065 RepID=UPI00361896EA
MRRYDCPACAATLFFDSIACDACGTRVGYVLDDDAFLAVVASEVPGVERRRCVNADLVRCNWLTRAGAGLCPSCERTRTRPRDDDAEGMRLWPVAEEAKRHLLRDVHRLGFDVDGSTPLRFDLLSSTDEDITIGHANGVITIDLSEGDHSHRERVRQQLDEPYRTMLGHLRHESGHYFEWQLVEGGPRIEEARALFGDERADYQAEIARHYDEGPPEGWQARHLSAYATMHPYEDFAECWAHVLHIHDTLETATDFGLVDPLPRDAGMRTVVVEGWLPFATAMNVVNRSLGRRDLYPFVLPDPVIEKLAFVDGLRPGS